MASGPDAGHHRAEPGSILLTTSLQILIDIGDVPSQAAPDKTGPLPSAIPHQRDTSPLKFIHSLHHSTWEATPDTEGQHLGFVMLAGQLSVLSGEINMLSGKSQHGSRRFNEQDSTGSIPHHLLFHNSLSPTVSWLDLSLHLVIGERVFSKIISGFAMIHKIDLLRYTFPPLHFYVTVKDNALWASFLNRSLKIRTNILFPYSSHKTQRWPGIQHWDLLHCISEKEKKIPTNVILKYDNFSLSNY